MGSWFKTSRVFQSNLVVATALPFQRIAEFNSDEHNVRSSRIAKMYEGGTMFHRNFWWFVVLEPVINFMRGA